ncbi:type 4a pilus biogenesis protein PilO [Candidatus Electrothrix sp.]|uniref:type 4a pilus biogenesis protein PilO n=1 Tax=Candidatus Electrothrix sp. TaxID=2170559 RepID=UPI004055DD52
MASETTKSKFDAFITGKYIPLDQKIKIALPVVVVIALLAGFYFFILSPKIAEIKELETKRVSLQADVDKAKKAADNLEQHEAERAEIEKRFDEISISLPKIKEIPKLLTDISDHGTSSGLDFYSFTPGSETPKEFYAEIPISINVRGPYHNVGYFLDQVSKLERIVTVQNITMGSPKKVEGEMLLSSSCNLLTYRLTSAEERSAQKKKKKK